ncbi:MAG: acyl-CoA dehydrogenase family protein, partial [Gammaproteobacteria bacterium]|nr:acyl-CoA dehydrogenase family protein [Gammaproteobacteria bacterium]
MKPESVAHTESVHAVASRLHGELRRQTGLGLRQIRRFCEKNGKFDPSLMDRHQQLCYELALTAAELSAAGAMLRYAGEWPDDELVQGIALSFAAETYHGLIERLGIRASEMGLGAGSLTALEQHADVRDYLDTNLSAERWEALGRTICEQQRLRLPSSLPEEIEIVRDSFQRFADEVVEPQAERIHREDLDIPESLIEAAAELGCFGTSIPERFGGLQPDDRPDSLAMIVVTEELSRGSLGAAGSLITR